MTTFDKKIFSILEKYLNKSIFLDFYLFKVFSTDLEKENDINNESLTDIDDETEKKDMFFR